MEDALPEWDVPLSTITDFAGFSRCYRHKKTRRFTLAGLSVGTAPAFSAVAGAAPALSWGFGGWNS
jgi:hypothetical protein